MSQLYFAIKFICNRRYTLEIPEPAPFRSGHGAEFGGLQVFSRNPNNRGLSGAYETCIPRSEHEDKQVQNAARPMKILTAIVLCKLIFECVVGTNPKTPKLSPMADTPLHGVV